jgi:hypothetical protein
VRVRAAGQVVVAGDLEQRQQETCHSLATAGLRCRWRYWPAKPEDDAASGKARGYLALLMMEARMAIRAFAG